VSYGVTDDFVSHIATHEEGPLIAVYLAANPLELDALRSMSPMQQAIKIENDIRAKASALKPKPSQAPEPPTTLNGNGATPGTSPWLEGGTYS
jgi:predicted GIY-YIG superfamily endonuclease